MIGCAGRNLLSLDRFVLSCSVCYVLPSLPDGECVSTFAWWVTEPYRELV